MNFTDYEYKGLVAQAWDVLRGDTSNWPDRFFYKKIIQENGQPVLDVGCGTGRLLLDYLSQGMDVEGVDNSPDMLEICRKKAGEQGLAPKLYEQYVETLELPKKYRTILVPSSTLQLIVEPSEADKALKRLIDHLLPGGVIVASIMTLWKEGEPHVSEMERASASDQDGVKFRRVSKSFYIPESECEDTEDLYQMLVGDKVVLEETHRRFPATRSYTQSQAKALFDRAGFKNIKLFSEFTFDPVKPDDMLFVVSGENPT